MNINFLKIQEIYGIEIVEEIKNNLKDVSYNINYLNDLGFSDPIDIFERYAPIFIDDRTHFQTKVNRLINKLGSDYVDIIETDLEKLDELM